MPWRWCGAWKEEKSIIYDINRWPHNKKWTKDYPCPSHFHVIYKNKLKHPEEEEENIGEEKTEGKEWKLRIKSKEKLNDGGMNSKNDCV